MSTAEMLECSEMDARLAQIDRFELMDWHYAIEQVKALDHVVGFIHAVSDSPSASCFRYSHGRSRDLFNSPEPELQLVA